MKDFWIQDILASVVAVEVGLGLQQQHVVGDAEGEVLRVVEKRYVNGSKGRCRIVFQTPGKNARMNRKRKIREVVLFVVRDINICLVARSELQWGRVVKSMENTSCGLGGGQQRTSHEIKRHLLISPVDNEIDAVYVYHG